MHRERVAAGARQDAARRGADQAAFMALGAHERHRRLLAEREWYGSKDDGTGPSAPVTLPRTDAQVLAATHEFLRDDAADAARAGDWEVALARRYYSALFREYAVADLSRWRVGAVGLRWRTRAEVVAGKGQFSCGTLGCDETSGLATLEVPFAYREHGQRKLAAVKLRLCPLHARQLAHTRGRDGKKGTDGDPVAKGGTPNHPRVQEHSPDRRCDGRQRTGRDGEADDGSRRTKRSRRERSADRGMRSSPARKRDRADERSSKNTGRRSLSAEQCRDKDRARSRSAETSSPGRWGDDETSAAPLDPEFERFLQGLMPDGA